MYWLGEKNGKTHITNIKSEKGSITINPTDIKMIEEYYEQHFTNTNLILENDKHFFNLTVSNRDMSQWEIILGYLLKQSKRFTK